MDNEQGRSRDLAAMVVPQAGRLVLTVDAWEPYQLLEPIRTPVKAVSDYPGEPERSNQHYRANPVTLEELGLTAWCGDEPMSWEPKLDHDALKEIWLRFENDQAKFPLYPDRRAWIHYAYTIGEIPLRTALQPTETDSMTVFDWPTSPLNARYRFECRFSVPGSSGRP